MSHTPGPWGFFQHVPEFTWHIGKSPTTYVKGDPTIASVSSEVDARLIAAAPDLLAALESAVRELEHEFGTDNPRARQFDTVIIKAKGEE